MDRHAEDIEFEAGAEDMELYAARIAAERDADREGAMEEAWYAEEDEA